MLFASPQPSDAELAEVYNEDYYDAFGFDEESPSHYRRMKQLTYESLLRTAEKMELATRLPDSRFARRRKLLDVGSALGDMLSVAERRHWEAWGVEPNPYAVELANTVAPGRTFLGTLADWEQAGEANDFDCAACIDVIEHLRDPLQELRRMLRLVRPGGRLLVVTPNVKSWLAKSLGSRWAHFHRDHLWYFDRRTLVLTVHRAGWDVIGCQTAKKTFCPRYLLEIFARHEQDGWARRAARCGLRWFPDWLKNIYLPPLGEGIFLLAQRPE